jgi:hypothetical protein
VNLLDRVIIGQTFRTSTGESRPYFTTWRITSVVMWSKIGTRFVWCEATRHRKWRPRPFELDQITGKIGDDLRDYFKANPHDPPADRTA